MATRPIAPGIAAWGLMTGVAMMKSGLSLVESLSMALLVFAGSSQLASMPLIIAGAPMWVVLATGFCVNLRFVVFSIHLRPYMMHQPLWRRLLSGYLTADMSYVMFIRRFHHPASPGESGAGSGARGVSGGQLLRQLVQLGRRVLGWHCSGQLYSAALGAGICRYFGLAGYCLLAGQFAPAHGVLRALPVRQR